jgi:hypothetical protein
MPKQAIRALFAALGVESAGVAADAAWHAVWHHTMRGEGLLHSWPHELMAAGFLLTWAAALSLLWSTRHVRQADVAQMTQRR